MRSKSIRLAKSAVIYIRVSTEEQARDAYGLESQEKACREFCQERGWTVLGGFSGTLVYRAGRMLNAPVFSG